MSTTTSAIDEKVQRQLAVDLFNETWTLLDKTDRTIEETDRMIHAAHASRLHWESIGTAKNLSIGEWQVARVLAVVGHADAALYHARRCLEISQRAELDPFYVAYAHEAIARALSLARHVDVIKHLATARELAAKIADADERKMLEDDLATVVV